MFRNSVRTGYGVVVGSAGDLAAVAEEGGDIVTKTEIAEILRSHDEWLGGADAGRRADLSSADLRGANLRGANLPFADLHNADLRGANLRSADLSSADLHNADLHNADLRGANLRDADLRGANLRGANLILAGQDIRGFSFYAYADDNHVVVIRAGCRQFRGIAAAMAYWEARHTDDAILMEDCLSLVNRIARMAAIRGWKLEPVGGLDKTAKSM